MFYGIDLPCHPFYIAKLRPTLGKSVSHVKTFFKKKPPREVKALGKRWFQTILRRQLYPRLCDAKLQHTQGNSASHV